MPVKIHNKLVRDKIPANISARGDVPFVRELNSEEFFVALKQKLLEEANEAVGATSNADLLIELADLLEVIETLTLGAGFTLDELKLTQAQKRAERGGFEKKIFLEKVGER